MTSDATEPLIKKAVELIKAGKELDDQVSSTLSN